MHSAFRNSLVVAALASVVVVAAPQPSVAFCRHCCCRTCRRPAAQCVCPQPAAVAVPQTTYQPVVETQYAQQPVLQQRDVMMTEYRNEAVVETVPSTVYENVTVDEGSYQTVWVPRLTTKAVARTVYQNRLSSRTVPYQVTRRVSEYATQTVPYQAVRYVPSTSTGLAYTTTPGYATILPPVYSTGSVIAGGTYPAIVSSPILPAPAIAARPLGSSSSAVPDARFADTPATPITPRSGSTADRWDRSDPAATRSADRGPSLFVPAPSAAQVWRSTYNTSVR